MIPLRDSTRSYSSPVVVYAIIAASLGAFLYTQGLGPDQAMRVYTTYGAIPAAVVREPHPDAWVTLVTSMFLHGSWLHLGGNMLYLWVFGDNIEDAMGHGPFLLFYLVAGVLAALAHVATQPGSTVPLIGASDAIAGVLGAYLILYPRARILSLVFYGFFVRPTELPAVLVLGLWFVLQLIEGLWALGAPGTTTVAFWAHVGGFIAGALLVPVFVRRR